MFKFNMSGLVSKRAGKVSGLFGLDLSGVKQLLMEGHMVVGCLCLKEGEVKPTPKDPGSSI